MKIRGGLFAGFGALLLACPGTAFAAEPLDCMAGAYTPEQQAQLDKVIPKFSLTDEKQKDKVSEVVAALAVEAAATCTEQNNWPEEGLYYAMLYEISRLSEISFRQSGKMTADELRLFDEALAKRDRTTLWNLMERAVMAGLNEEEAKFTTQEEVTLGAFVIAAGLGSDEAMGEKVGELLGMMALMRYSKREFAALQPLTEVQE